MAEYPQRGVTKKISKQNVGQAGRRISAKQKLHRFPTNDVYTLLLQNNQGWDFRPFFCNKEKFYERIHTLFRSGNDFLQSGAF